ncbi:hypothetical protein F4780DRAFT_744760 [Xylariomycetidae sp. FL0641]|nr:hypothetical protein F4780DRAFT_744760 [Xylariomycetidae sp. FL0641]
MFDIIQLPGPPHYEPTDDVPIVTEEMAQLLQRLDHDTLVDVSMYILSIAKGLVREANLPKCFRDLVQDEEARSPNWMLLVHSMPKERIRSTILGVSASLGRLPERHPQYLERDVYRLDGPGTYVVNVAVSGRQGRGMTGRELMTLTANLAKYITAYDLTCDLHDHGMRQLTADEDSLMSLAEEVDRAYTAPVRGRTAMLNSVGQRAKVRSMLKRLREMQQRAKPDVPMAQLIGYYGCSRESTEERSHHHQPRKGWDPNKSNYAYWLFMSLMSYQGLDPEAVVTPVIRTWAPGQLPLSETIGTLMGMGGSLVEGWGFNVGYPGGTKDKPHKVFTQEELGAKHHRPYLRENLAASIATLQARSAALEHLDGFDPNRVCSDMLEAAGAHQKLAQELSGEAETMLETDAIARLDEEIATCRDTLKRLSLLDAVLDAMSKSLLESSSDTDAS